MAETNDSAGATPGATPVPAVPGAAPVSGSSAPLEINLTSHPQLDDPAQFAQATDGSSSEPPAADVAFQERPYNPDESRDWTRQTIALWLIGLVCSIVGLTFVAVFAHGAATGFASPTFFSELKQVLDVIAGPIITLLASAIGYYFGSKQGDNAPKAGSAGAAGSSTTTGSGGK